MCGLAGVFSYRDVVADDGELRRMSLAMRSRGPDGSGEWFSDDRTVGLAHRRLAIIDPTDNSRQPFSSRDGNVQIVFNGEIYNYLELREDLTAKGFSFVSTGDTEVVLALFLEYGVGFVSYLRGMFAIAIWDGRCKKLHLARDKLGIKPLYYCDDGRTIRFASRAKAIVAGNSAFDSPDPAAFVSFCTLGYVAEPHSAYAGVRALDPAAILTIDRFGAIQKKIYWNFTDLSNIVSGHEEDDSTAIFKDCIKKHTVADVPISLFLSAGIDSAVLCSYLSTSSLVRVSTDTLTFPEYIGSANDESELASEVASQFGLRHSIHYGNKEMLSADSEHFFEAMDSPSIDGLNMYFLSSAIKNSGIRVAISGLGADELFGGYPSFSQVPSLASIPRLPWLGKSVRKTLSRLNASFLTPKYISLLEYCGDFAHAYFLKRALYMPWELDKLLDRDFAYEGWNKLNLIERLDETASKFLPKRLKVTALEINWYMRNQLLRDADWAGMANSVEIRVPYVDSELITHVIKRLLSGRPITKAQVLGELKVTLPERITRRKKTGFTVPVRGWISNSGAGKDARTGSREWAKVVLDHFSKDKPWVLSSSKC